MNSAKTKNDLSWRVPSIALLLTFMITSRPPTDTDMWWHLRAGEFQWQTKQILTADVFSYTRFGAHWANVFWVSDLILYGAYQLAGYFGLAFFTSLMAAVIFYVVYKRMDGNPLLRAAFILLAAITVSPIWTARPQLFSFLFLAINEISTC